MPPQKGFSLLMLPVFWLGLASCSTCGAHKPCWTPKEMNILIYTALRTMDDYIFFIFTSFNSFTSFTSIQNSNPNRNQRSSNLFQTLPSFCYTKLSFYRSSHSSYLISRTTTSCRRIAPTASTAFKVALPLAQNAPLREPLTVTTPTLVPMYSLPPSLPFSLSFSSSKASNGSLGLT